MNKWFYTLVLFAFINSAQADTMTAEQHLTAALKTLDSVQVDFEQTVINDNKEVVQQSSGSLAIQRPKKFNWTYEIPYEQKIIADGEHIWVYDVDLKQATVRPMDDSVGNTPIMVLLNSKRLETDFNINEIGQKKFLYWIELTPKVDNSQFKRLYFGLKDNEIMAMDLRDTFGQSTQITFKNHRYNVIHNPNVFSFEATPDIDVLSGQN